MIQILLTCLVALMLDRFVPDRGGLKLLDWYSDWAESIESRFNGGLKSQGVVAVATAIVPIVLAVFVVRYLLGQVHPLLAFAFNVFVLYMGVDLYRVGRLAVATSEALEEGDLPEAHRQLLVLTGKERVGGRGRDEEPGIPEVSEAGIAQATIEAVLKQGNSLVIAPLFWFVVLGPVGVALARLAAVLDRLWGHRDHRFAQFGWAAARLDDVLGWVPARITALSYAIMGSFEDALHCWRRRAGMWSDINSGPLLASGFGAMHLQNCDEDAPGPEGGHLMAADAGHVRRVVALLWRVLLFWLFVAVMMTASQIVSVLF